MEWLFSYGTLQQEDVQQANFGRLLEGHADQLPGYTIGSVQITDARVIRESGKDIPDTAPQRQSQRQSRRHRLCAEPGRIGPSGRL